MDQRLGRQRLDEWFEEWWSARSELRPTTIARDESLYRNHILPRFGDVALSSIDYQLITAWVASLRDRGLSPATIRRCHLLLSKLLAGSVKARRIPRNPCQDTDNLPSVVRKEMRIVTAGQLQVLADSMGQVTRERLERHPPNLRPSDTRTAQIADSFAAFVLLGGYGGLRLGELAGLRKSKIDPKRRTVRVDASLIEVRGKLIEGQPKTTAGIRTVPLPALYPSDCVRLSAISALGTTSSPERRVLRAGTVDPPYREPGGEHDELGDEGQPEPELGGL
ncbi:MAG: site-specific integrase [Microthrixaceae bacterium]